jgi:hypothetical protein
MAFFSKNKKIYIWVLTLVMIIVIVLIIKINPDIRQNVSSDDAMSLKEPILSFGQITREERLKHVEWTYTHGKQYPQYSLIKNGPKDIIVTFYQPDNSGDISKEESNGGILLFKIENGTPKLIWENNDNVGGVHPTIWVTDVTGDNDNEILVNWGNGKYDTLFIYTSFDDSLKLISPQYQPFLEYNVTSYSPVFNARDGTIEVSDINGDKIPEIWFPTKLTESGELTEEYYVAYKWDGSKYIRWKEQAERFAE